MTTPTPDSQSTTWPVNLSIPVAWGDLDAFNHVNNTVYFRWFESARIAYFERVGMLDAMHEHNVGPILARTHCDFRLPITYPDQVTASTRISRVGKTSFVMEYQVTSTKHQGAIAAAGEGIVVMVSYRNGQKTPVSAQVREAIEGLEGSDLA